MKNILVLKHYKLKNKTVGWPSGTPSPLHRLKVIDAYEEMKYMCMASAKHFVLGLDDIVVHNAEVDNIQEAFRQHFYELYDLWKTGDVNILYADLDVLFVKKFNWFDMSDYFVMYDPINSGIRYHKYNMDEKLWELAFEMCKNWNFNKWDYEQDIYKKMWQQQYIMQSCQNIHPDIYQRLVINRPEYNSVEEFFKKNSDCCAVHFHASRGNKLDHIRRMFNFLKI
jgi:hypothetical protein